MDQMSEETLPRVSLCLVGIVRNSTLDCQSTQVAKALAKWLGRL